MHRTAVAQPAEGFVYIMESSGYYKIGWAKKSPRKRQAGIQTGNPLPVTLVGVIEGSRLIEAEWHAAFRDKHVRGEWFALTDEDVARVLHESHGLDKIPEYGGGEDAVPSYDEGADWIPPDDEPA